MWKQLRFHWRHYVGILDVAAACFLGDKNTFSRTVTTATRCVIGAIRTVPSILFGVIFVVAFGLGPAAGTLGVAFYTVGYLGKFIMRHLKQLIAKSLKRCAARGVIEFNCCACLAGSRQYDYQSSALCSNTIFVLQRLWDLWGREDWLLYAGVSADAAISKSFNDRSLLLCGCYDYRFFKSEAAFSDGGGSFRKIKFG